MSWLAPARAPRLLVSNGGVLGAPNVGPPGPVAVGTYVVSVEALACAHRVLLTDQQLLAGGLAVVVGGDEIQTWHDPVSATARRSFVDALNANQAIAARMRAYLQADGSVVLQATLVGASSVFTVTTASGAPPPTVQVAGANANVTVDRKPVATDLNDVSFAGVTVSAVGVGASNVTIADSLAPRWVYILDLIYLLAIPAYFFVRSNKLEFVSFVPHSIATVPTQVIVFGALGAVVISLQGIYFNNRKWDPSYNFWHATRPYLGAAFALVAVLFVNIVAQTTPKTPPLTYDALGFIVGYSEAAFRSLLTSVTNVLIKPGPTGTSPAGSPPHTSSAGPSSSTETSTDGRCAKQPPSERGQFYSSK